MNHAIKAIDHENKIRRWQTFTPPQRTAYAAHCGLVLHWRAYEVLRAISHVSVVNMHTQKGSLHQTSKIVRYRPEVERGQLARSASMRT
jgi:hypothetical protein